jgi:hypothetical protein
MLPEGVQTRITKIRNALKEERAALIKLEKAKALKSMLMDVSSLLDLVESGFLSNEVLKRTRTPREWSYWLSGAERFLKVATRQRKYLSGLVGRLGPDLRIIPG